MKCDKKDLLLYAVTDRHWLNGRTLYEVVKESLDGGVTFVQLREKTLDEGTFLEEAKELQKLCREYKVPFVINDNVDIAIAMDADGVHVGQSDMEAGDVRAKLGPDKIIGVSAGTVGYNAAISLLAVQSTNTELKMFMPSTSSRRFLPCASGAFNSSRKFSKSIPSRSNIPAFDEAIPTTFSFSPLRCISVSY